MEETGEGGSIPGATRCAEKTEVWCLAEGAVYKAFNLCFETEYYLQLCRKHAI